MSWLFSRALGAEFSAANSSGGEPSAPSNATPTPQAFLWRGKTTEFWRRFPSGMTCEPSTATHGVALLTWFQEVFLARTFQSPAKATASTANGADSGANSPGSLAKFDPATHSLRTAQCLLFEEGTELLQTLPRWGFLRDGELFPLPTPEHLTDGNESGLWGTPRAGMARGNNFYYDRGKGNLEEQVGAAETMRESFLTPTAYDAIPDYGARKNSNLEEGGRSGVSLRHMTKLWPTPTADDASGPVKPGKDNQFQMLRRDPRLWPTPQAHDAAPGDSKRVNRFGTLHGGRNLNDEVAMWPTPCTPNGRRTNRPEDIENKGTRPDGSKVQVSLKSAAKMWPTPTTKDNMLSPSMQKWPAHQNLFPMSTVDDAHNVTRTSGAFSSLTREV